MASELLGNAAFISKVNSCFNPNDKIVNEEVTDELKKKGDEIQKMLHKRLTKHLSYRITDPKIRKHWSFEWARKNFPHMAAVMALHGHVKDNIMVLGENATLLKSAAQYIDVKESDTVQNGAYLYFDTNDECWIRSRKADNCCKRYEDHWKKTTDCFTTGKFYMRYPSKARNGTVAGRNGSFEDLKMYRAIGFVADDIGTLKRMVETDEGGMFVFDKYDVTKINKMNLRGRSMWDKKATTMISYLIELVYDIMISPIDNVSVNPGFESCHGVW